MMAINSSNEVEAPKKAKATIYMTEADENLLNEIFIKRLRDRRKTDKSALLCEGLSMERFLIDSSFQSH